MREKTYDNLRRLAIVDLKRRLNNLGKKLGSWQIVDKEQPDGVIEKLFVYQLDVSSFVNLTLNEYAIIREIKYIVWRFDISAEDIEKEK